jgi:exopolysaccharide biosynthesis polyprenyl glycosylphosphotransferase
MPGAGALLEDESVAVPNAADASDAAFSSVGRISNVRRSVPSERNLSFSSKCRITIAIGLATFDALGAAAAVGGFFSGRLNFELSALAVACVLLGGQVCGLQTAHSSADLQKSLRGAMALGVVLLAGVIVVGSILWGWSLARYYAVDVGCGLSVVLVGRVICNLIVWVCGKRLAERVVIVGTCEAGDRLTRSTSPLNHESRIVGQIVVGDGTPCVPLTGRIDKELIDSISPYSLPKAGVDRAVILNADLSEAELACVVRWLEPLSIPICISASSPPLVQRQFGIDGVEWIVRGSPLGLSAAITKRIFDILISVSLLVWLAPLMLLIAALIRWETPGPALFRQTRIGRNNQPFTVLKFRTMRCDRPTTSSFVQAVRGDPRVTRVGAFLRKTSIDELPQLLNVFNGTMSLVGPRPHVPELHLRFLSVIDGYSARHRVAPGITGLAQVNGCRGATTTIEQMQMRVYHDLAYIKRFSVMFDFWILLRTVFVIIGGRNAY